MPLGIKNYITCENCVPIGEGDHFCDEVMELVIVDYEPSEYFGTCKGGKFKCI